MREMIIQMPVISMMMMQKPVIASITNRKPMIAERNIITLPSISLRIDAGRCMMIIIMGQVEKTGPVREIGRLMTVLRLGTTFRV